MPVTAEAFVAYVVEIPGRQCPSWLIRPGPGGLVKGLGLGVLVEGLTADDLAHLELA